MKAIRIFPSKKSQVQADSSGNKQIAHVRCPACRTQLDLKPTMKLWEEIECKQCHESLMLIEDNPPKLEIATRALFRKIK